MVKLKAKRGLVGAGARILFYPTLLCNVLRNKVESEFRWWDRVDHHVLLGAVPFPRDVPRLKQLGVGGVITLNEPYETLVPTSLYRAHGIKHLVIPTRDYLFAPSFADIGRVLNFIHGDYTYALGLSVYKIVSIDILEVEYKHMPPMAALEYVRSIRPRVLLAQSQWKAVQEYGGRQHTTAVNSASGDVVLIAKADLERYHATCDNGGAGKEQVVLPRIKARPPVMARLSCLFACLKVSGVLVPIIGQLPDARAC